MDSCKTKTAGISHGEIFAGDNNFDTSGESSLKISGDADYVEIARRSSGEIFATPQNFVIAGRSYLKISGGNIHNKTVGVVDGQISTCALSVGVTRHGISLHKKTITVKISQDTQIDCLAMVHSVFFFCANTT